MALENGCSLLFAFFLFACRGFFTSKLSFFFLLSSKRLKNGSFGTDWSDTPPGRQVLSLGSKVPALLFFFLLSAGLANWHPADPHPVVLAAGPWCGHPQLRPPVGRGRVPTGDARWLLAAGSHLEVSAGVVTVNKDFVSFSTCQKKKQTFLKCVTLERQCCSEPRSMFQEHDPVQNSAGEEESEGPTRREPEQVS